MTNETTETELTNEYHEQDPEIAQTPIKYDARTEQKIPFALTRNGREYRVSHTLQPLSAERYFEFREEIEEVDARTRKVSTAIYEPKHKLWKELAISREGFKETADWKESTHPSIAASVIDLYLHTLAIDPSEQEPDDDADDVLFDDEAPTRIEFRVLQAGALLTLSHSFAPETKAQMDQFMAIMLKQPEPNVLASAKRRSLAEKLCKLGRPLLVGHEGYADGSPIPPWHLAATVESYFLRRIAQVGKSFPTE